MQDYSVDPARLRGWIISRSRCGCRYGGNLPGFVCGYRSTFWSRLWSRGRSCLCICGDAARLRMLLRVRQIRPFSKMSGRSRIVFHGDRDAIVHPRNADNVIARSMKIKNWQKKVHRGQVPGGHAYTRTIYTDENRQAIFEQWCIHGAGHAWSGGSPAGSYTNPRGPDAAREMLRFFRDNPAARRNSEAANWRGPLGELIYHLQFVRRLVGRPLSSNSGRHRQASGTAKRLHFSRVVVSQLATSIFACAGLQSHIEG